MRWWWSIALVTAIACGSDTDAAPDSADAATTGSGGGDGKNTPGGGKDDGAIGVDPRELLPDAGADAASPPDAGCNTECEDEPPAAEPRSFRVTAMSLLDPPIVVVVPITNLVNDSFLTPALTQDVDPADGFLDLSFVTVFTPLDPLVEAGDLDMLFADCPPPAAGTVCKPNAERGITVSRFGNRTEGVCLEPREGTLNADAPAVNVPAAPCFVSDPEPFALEFAGVLLELSDARVAASFQGSAADVSLVDGTVQGFLSKAVADGTTVPADRPLIGGLIVGDTFQAADLDEGPDGEPGYWVYLNFEADEVDYRE